jgi:hypothetical protein
VCPETAKLSFRKVTNFESREFDLLTIERNALVMQCVGVCDKGATKPFVSSK